MMPDDPKELSSGLHEIFGHKASPEASPAATQITHDTEVDAQGLDGLDEAQVAELQTESPAVERETQTAQDEPVPVPEAVTLETLEAKAPVETVPAQSEQSLSAQPEPGQPEAVPRQAEPVKTELTPPLEVTDTPETDAALLALPAMAASQAPPAIPSAPTGGLSNDLEEVVYAPSTQPSGPQEGAELDGYHLDEDLGRGWFSAHALADNSKHDVFVRPDPLWAGVAAHRLLPKTTRAGQLHVVEPMAGPPLPLPVDAAQARGYVQDFSRLLFALEKQGFAVTDIDPRSFLQTAQGLKLRFPPKLAKIGQAAEPTLRDGFTPPEVQAGQKVDSRSGIYLLGALLYQWLSGQPLPPEGASPVTLAGINAPGMPQLLAKMLVPDPAQRAAPQDLLEYLKVQAANEIPKYDIAAATNIGLNPERPMNEDSYGYVERQIEAHGASELFIRACVADGMGGMAAGEVASRAAVQGFLNSTKSTLTEMVWDANANLLTALEGKDGGSTFSGVEIHGDSLQLGHVGDTRAHLASGGEVQQISKDHSYVAAMVASGQMTPDEAQHSPDRNKVLRSLGSLRVPQDNYVHTLAEPLRLKVGDRILLISDGVWGEVEPPVLNDLLLHQPDLQHLVDKLIELALASGAPDNITALALERVR